MVNVCGLTIYISLNKQAGPTLIDLSSNECNQGFCYYPFMVNFHKCNGSCNNLDDTSGKIYAPSKTEDINLSV